LTASAAVIIFAIAINQSTSLSFCYSSIVAIILG